MCLISIDAFWKEPNFTINRLSLEFTSVESILYKHWYVAVLIIRVDYRLRGPCTFTVGKWLFPQSEEGWACCTSNIVQTLVFYTRLPGLNRHWIDLVHPLSVNYLFHSRNEVGSIVSQHCTNVGNQKSISYIRPTFNRSSQSAECYDFCLGLCRLWRSNPQVQPSSDCGKSNFPTVNVQIPVSVYDN